MLICDRCKQVHHTLADLPNRVRRCTVEVASVDQRGGETPANIFVGEADLCNMCREDLLALFKTYFSSFLRSTVNFCCVEGCHSRVRNYKDRCSNHTAVA